MHGSVKTRAFSGVLAALVWFAAPAEAAWAADSEPIVSEAATFKLETVAEGLEVPWSFAFLPDGRALIGEREVGRLSILDLTSGTREPVEGLPDMLRDGSISAGLFDIVPHPDFATNRQIYLVHAVGSIEASGLAITRAELENDKLVHLQQLFETGPRLAGKWHFGGRLVLQGGYMFLTTGDGYEFKALSQDLSTHAGKIIRLHDDGKVPTDNPFVGKPDARPEIWAYGLRNPQSMTLQPATGALWTVEHGPQGGDEVNVIKPGRNYGWPVITYGEEYGGGPIGDGITHKEGMEQPLYYWRPSIAPSGATFYTGASFPGWQGSLFVGALAQTHLNRLVVEDGRVIHEERLLADQGWRVRFVVEGPDGCLYIGNDDGLIVRLRAAAND
ncbi:PQQ-dependent sugar dehydrogenase [Gimibacter soli]|uniref:PQQ-dependent sugar dehydrogenase n=1 Tax=Gimibacter soli TaxID=3024400 RepID=A0AAE9XRH6_9PROT|nr:PQQ-dependent sugar dehydrogenase [Gimibacter soli]WCL54892.1 PQQ-dependent sugar dehydrogenase [Gimibacter soli]